jgi:flagellar biogenesis protein FliO
MAKSFLDKFREQAEEYASMGFFLFMVSLLIVIAMIVLGGVYLLTRR